MWPFDGRDEYGEAIFLDFYAFTTNFQESKFRVDDVHYKEFVYFDIAQLFLLNIWRFLK